MILADTSIWVDHLRGADTEAARSMQRVLRESFDDLRICEPIAMELMAGGPPEPGLSRLVEVVDGIPALEVNAVTDFRAAAHTWRRCRAAGRPVRSLVDCLIAAVALRYDAVVLHKDRDYGTISAVTGLRQIDHR